MKDDFTEYSAYLKDGMRVEVGIPLSGGGVFRDWAVISEFFQDELVAQISRDVLPANVRVDVGTILDMSVHVGKDAYTCSCIVTEKRAERTLRIRLFGRFTLQERRQFFRLELGMRGRYAVLLNEDREAIKRDWERRKELEQMKFQGYDRFVLAAHQAQYPPPLEVDWKDLPLSEGSNLGGGGARLRLREPVHPEHLLNLELHLPVQPPRLIYTVVEVIYVLEPKTVRGKTVYPAGVKFLYLDERDRDLIFQHISVLQIAHLHKLSETREVPEPEEKGEEPRSWQEVAKRSALVLLVLILSFVLVKYLIHYSETSPNPIEKTYERSIKEHRGIE